MMPTKAAPFDWEFNSKTHVQDRIYQARVYTEDTFTDARSRKMWNFVKFVQLFAGWYNVPKAAIIKLLF